MKLIWTPQAAKSYQKIIEFLEQHWNHKIVFQFIISVETAMKLLEANPKMYQKWEGNLKYFKGHIDEHTSFFYSISNEEIIVHLFWSNLRNPKKLKKILNG